MQVAPLALAAALKLAATHGGHHAISAGAHPLSLYTDVQSAANQQVANIFTVIAGVGTLIFGFYAVRSCRE